MYRGSNACLCSDLNRLVLNYLVIEGFKDAAEEFCAETGMTPPTDLSSIEARMRVRNAIQSGQIEQAMELVNDLNPEILDTAPHLFFHVQQQRLIELIRSGDVSGALQFAQEELAPRGEENPQFLEELEKTIALLAFPVPKGDGPQGSLLHHSQRQKLASELNAAILASQHQDRDPKLPGLLKMLAWGQKLLGETVRFPQLVDISTGELAEPPAAPAPSQ